MRDPFKFKKCRQLFISVHHVTVTIAAMRVGDEDRSPFAIHDCDAAPTPTALLRLSVVRLDVLKELGEEMNFWINGPRNLKSSERNTMLWTIIVILVVLWLLGFLGHVGGGLIHLLLVVAVVVLIINLIQGRRGL